jgi:hypothetical protein
VHLAEPKADARLLQNFIRRVPALGARDTESMLCEGTEPDFMIARPDALAIMLAQYLHEAIVEKLRH